MAKILTEKDIEIFVTYNEFGNGKKVFYSGIRVHTSVFKKETFNVMYKNNYYQLRKSESDYFNDAESAELKAKELAASFLREANRNIVIRKGLVKSKRLSEII